MYGQRGASGDTLSVAEMVLVPALTAVARPAALIVALLVLEEDQVDLTGEVLRATVRVIPGGRKLLRGTGQDRRSRRRHHDGRQRWRRTWIEHYIYPIVGAIKGLVGESAGSAVDVYAVRARHSTVRQGMQRRVVDPRARKITLAIAVMPNVGVI